MTTKQIRVCTCEGRKMRPDILYCSVRCVINDPLRSDRVQIKSCSVSDLNNLPNGLNWVYIYFLERTDHPTISSTVEPVDGGYIMKQEVVNNLPISLEELTIHWSCIPEEDIRVPYGCKLYVRNAYANPVYPEQYDTICHMFEYQRVGLHTLKQMGVFTLKEDR